MRLNGEWLRGGWRAVTSLNYLSSFLFRLAWSPTFNQAIDSEVHSNAFVSKNFNGYSFGMLAARYQNFQSINNGDEIKILHTPSVGFSTRGPRCAIDSSHLGIRFQRGRRFASGARFRNQHPGRDALTCAPGPPSSALFRLGTPARDRGSRHLLHRAVAAHVHRHVRNSCSTAL